MHGLKFQREFRKSKKESEEGMKDKEGGREGKKANKNFFFYIKVRFQWQISSLRVHSEV